MEVMVTVIDGRQFLDGYHNPLIAVHEMDRYHVEYDLLCIARVSYYALRLPNCPMRRQRHVPRSRGESALYSSDMLHIVA